MRSLLIVLLLTVVVAQADDLYLLTATREAGLQLSHNTYKAQCLAKGKAWNTNTHHTIYLNEIVPGTNGLSVVTYWMKITTANTNLLNATNVINLKTKAQVEAGGVNLGSINKTNSIQTAKGD